MDFVPEISYQEAHQEIGEVVSAWLSVQMEELGLGVDDKQASKVLEDWVARTQTFLDPLIAAFELESYYFFEVPCYLKYPDSATNGNSLCYQPEGGCQCGNRWTQNSVTLMAGLPQVTIQNADAMHSVQQIPPPPFPAINNTCSSPNPLCVLETDTVTQNIYNANITTDDPLYPLGAIEMRTEMKSRQALQEAAGVLNPDFNITDSDTQCEEINQWTFDWALSSAGERSATRFNQLGQRLLFGLDVVVSEEYSWINSPMTYTSTTLDQEEVILINSTAWAVSTSFEPANSAGVHYCKVLSPAWAMEWIYVDSLRLNDSLQSQVS
uniref:Uncharacterized protein n=1 Tax=Paramoeba aestuarina TaxID=180227 RepID=A0A7S4KNF5_9EUKA